jgi:hypothetical protein
MPPERYYFAKIASAPLLCEDKQLRLIDPFIVCNDFCKTLTNWQQQGSLLV